MKPKEACKIRREISAVGLVLRDKRHAKGGKTGYADLCAGVNPRGDVVFEQGDIDEPWWRRVSLRPEDMDKLCAWWMGEGVSD